MTPTTADAMNSFRELPAEGRRELLAGMIRDSVERDGSDETIRLLLTSVFGPRTPLMERQAETLAAFARLPKEAAAAFLSPMDVDSVQVEDCLTDAEVDRIVANAGS